MQFNFDTIPIPEDRLNQTVYESLNLVKKQHHRKRWGMITASAAAAAVVILSVIFISNPVLAAKIPVIGDIFKKVQHNQRYPGNFNEVATSVANTNSCSSNGYTMTLSEIYCDTEAMYVSVVLESEDPFPEEARSYTHTENDGKTYSSLYFNYTQKFDFFTIPDEFANEGDRTPMEVQGTYTDEHTFIGAFRIDFNLGTFASAEKIPHKFRWKLNVNKLRIPVEMSSPKLDFTWEEVKFTKGKWIFENDVTVDTSNTTVTEINDAAPNGHILTKLTLTSYEGNLESTFDESKILPGYEEIDTLQSIILDANGKELLNKVGMFSTAGYNLSEITVYYFKVASDENYKNIQETIRNTSESERKEYLESIAVHKTVIHPNSP